MKGLSRPQLGLLSILGLALISTLTASIMRQWMVAAVSAVITFGLFTILVVFTLAALTKSVRRSGEVINRAASRIHDASAGIRRIERRIVDRSEAFDSMQMRIEASERRLIAAFEAQRFHIEDDLEQLKHTAGEPDSSQNPS